MADRAEDTVPFRPITPHFPEPPLVSTPLEHGALWRLGREWSGYPELEWTFALFPDRVTAFSGRGGAFFYEPLTDFSTTHLITGLNAILLDRRVRSFPSATIGFQYFDSAYRTGDGRLPLPAEGDPFRGRHYAMTTAAEGDNELAFWGWNRDWGEHGRGYITRAYFDRYVDNVMVRWYAEGGPSRAFIRCLDRAETHKLSRP